jgi:uncharacterized membrane protein (DUF106 family)
MAKKNYGGYIAILVLLVMMIAYTVPAIRQVVGGAMDTIFGPLVGEVPFYILIVILSTVTALYSSLIQKYTIDYEHMQDVQARMKDFQKEFREAQLSQDEKKIKKLEAKRDRMMKEQMEMSQQQFKPMAYILVISVPIFFWLLFRLAEIPAKITMPFFGTQLLSAMVLGPIPAWILWYMICSLTLSQIVRKSLNIGGI